MDMMDGIIMGAAAAAIGTIISTVILNRMYPGEGNPAQGQPNNAPSPQFGQINPIAVNYGLQDPGQAPLAQNVPITEAAHRDNIAAIWPLVTPAMGTANNPAQEALLPI
jgi:hypothetical protein